MTTAMTGALAIERGVHAGAPARTPGVTVFKGIPYAAPPRGPHRRP